MASAPKRGIHLGKPNEREVISVPVLGPLQYCWTPFLSKMKDVTVPCSLYSNFKKPGDTKVFREKQQGKPRVLNQCHHLSSHHRRSNNLWLLSLKTERRPLGTQACLDTAIRNHGKRKETVAHLPEASRDIKWQGLISNVNTGVSGSTGVRAREHKVGIQTIVGTNVITPGPCYAAREPQLHLRRWTLSQEQRDEGARVAGLVGREDRTETMAVV